MSLSPLVRDIVMNGLLAGSAARSVKKTSAAWAYYVLAGGVAFAGFIFFAISAHSYLLQTFSMPIASAMVGSGILLLSAIIACFGYSELQGKRATPKRHVHDNSLVNSIEDTIKTMLEGLEEPVKDNPKTALLVAALAGFAAGDKIH